MRRTSSVRSKSSRYVPLRTTHRSATQFAAQEIFLLASICAFAVLNLHGQKSSYIFNVVTLVPGIAFSLKCYVQNNDQSALSVVLIASHWCFSLLALINEFILDIEENYICIRLLSLGALAVKAYQNVLMKASINNEEADTAVSRSALNDERLSNDDLLEKVSTHERNVEEQPFIKQPSSSQEAAPILGYQLMDPALQSTLRKIHTELHTALYAPITLKMDHFYDTRNNNALTIDKTQQFSCQSRLQSYFDRLQTAAARTNTHHIVTANKETGAKAQVEAILHQTEPFKSKYSTAESASEYETAICVLQPSAWNGNEERKLPSESPPPKHQQSTDNPKVAVHYGDLITNPMSRVQFSAKETVKRILVTNLATETVMWSLKADLKESFDATPAHGVLHTGEQQAIVICLIPRQFRKNEVKTGKIAIDYAFVHPFSPKFDKNTYISSEKRRHILQAIINW